MSKYLLYITFEGLGVETIVKMVKGELEVTLKIMILVDPISPKANISLTAFERAKILGRLGPWPKELALASVRAQQIESTLAEMGGDGVLLGEGSVLADMVENGPKKTSGGGHVQSHSSP